ncbi:MAG TPA: M48 family metallopeptidase [Acidimicrobiales bacterium]|nr:M48 family metallopeptidase [Acidimicrobiales bacterium]
MFDQIASNKRRSVVLVATFVVVLGLAVWAFDTLIGFGIGGVVIAFLFAGLSAFIGYWKSDAVALAMSHAKPADPTEYARLHNIVEGLCIAAGLPKPRIYVIDDPAPNAFATGRDPKHAAVAVTTGLLEKMNRIELEGVLAHELSHVKNYDILVSTMAVTMVGMIVLLSDWGLRFLWWGGGRSSRRDNNNNGGGAGAILALAGFALLLLTPLVAKLMQFAVSRRRESLADVSGVALTRYPPGLISALEKLRDDNTVVHSGSRATAHLWIESPVAREPEEGKLAWLGRMFDTHPPLEERIQALREL